MSLAIGLRDYLIADTTVSFLIDDRIYQEEADESAEEPYLLIQFAGDDSPRLLSGLRAFQRVRYEIKCCGLDWEAVDELQRTVKEAIGGADGESVAYDLDGDDVIMFWADNSESANHVSAADAIRHQRSLNLVILVQP